MAKPKSNYSTIKIKDKRYITIYFRNTHFRSGYQISDLSEFNKTTKKFSSNWKKQNPKGLEAIEKVNLKKKKAKLLKLELLTNKNLLRFLKNTLKRL